MKDNLDNWVLAFFIFCGLLTCAICVVVYEVVRGVS